jgi:hypothetical protein
MFNYCRNKSTVVKLIIYRGILFICISLNIQGKMFHTKITDANEVCILYHVQIFERRSIFEKIDKFVLEIHVKQRLCMTQTNQN